MDTTTASIDKLSQREREILALIARGRTNPEIAEALGLRFDTVKWYVSEILSKLGVDSREQAADAWRSYRRPGVMVSRRLRGLIGVPLAKAGMGVAGAAAAGTLVVALAGSYRGESPAWAAADATPTPTTTSRPWQPPDLSDYSPTGPQADIVSTTFDQTTVTLGAFKTKSGYGFFTRSSDRPGSLFTSYRGQPKPLLVGGHGGIGGSIDAAGNRIPARPFGTLNGVVEDNVAFVRIHTSAGDLVEAEPLAGPADLDLPFKYWIAAVERPDQVVLVEALDARGHVVQSEALYDPAGGPRTIHLPPYEEVNFGVSGRDDPSTGTVGMGTGAQSFSVDGLAHDYRFGVEHDGADLPGVILWCQTGIVPIDWDAGTTSNGTGSFTASVPAGNAACHWNVSGDGNLRIFALP